MTTVVVPHATRRPDRTVQPPAHRRHRPALTRPRIDTLIAVTAAVVVSLLPAVLPRTSISQAILTAVPVAFAIGMVALLRVVLGRWRIDIDERMGRLRVPVLLLCGFVVTASAARAAAWQNGLHAAMGMAPAGTAYWLRCVLGTALIVVFLVGTGRGMRWGIRKLVRL